MERLYQKEGNTMHKINDILTLVADVFDVETAAITGSSRRRFVFEARAAAAWLLRQCFPSLGLVEIGRLLGHRDHTTIINALSRVEERRSVDAEYRALLDELYARCRPAQSLSSSAEVRKQVRQQRQRAVAWWVRQSVPWQPLVA